MRGRKPKPIELRVLHGGAAEKALAEHPKPRRVLPRCPPFLTGEAATCWRRLSRELFAAGLLSAVDRDALAVYCTVYARWLEAERMIAEVGIVKESMTGKLARNPYLAIAQQSIAQLGKLAAEFGMTPSSRSRVKAEISAAKQQAQTGRQAHKQEPMAAGPDPRKVLDG